MATHTVIRSTEQAAIQQRPEFFGAIYTDRDRLVYKTSPDLQVYLGSDFRDVKRWLEASGFRVKLLREAQ